MKKIICSIINIFRNFAKIRVNVTLCLEFVLSSNFHLKLIKKPYIFKSVKLGYVCCSKILQTSNYFRAVAIIKNIATLLLIFCRSHTTYFLAV